ncbi:MAG: hypothetical protein M3252_08255 [Actinomycetota bacterium]|nr:hypothetical protein [Actinomycetota bacterium]
MTTLGRQATVRRRTVVAIAVAATVILPLALPAGAENLSAGTPAVVDGLLDTVDEGAGTTAGVVQQTGSGTPLQATTNKTSSTAQKTTTAATGTLRQPASPAPNPVLNPQQGAPIVPHPAPAPAPPPSALPMTASSAGLPTLSSGSASGLRVDAATLLLARDATAMPLIAEALSASPSGLVLVAEPLARSLNAPVGSTSAGTTTSSRAEEVQNASHLPRGLLTEALIAAALLVAATAALVAELGLKRSSPPAT